ncbi:T9SS type A sorting domain-containing protein [Lewinella sp. 4G2]|uniref:T9SS type A sorting domain-containing protein n=1 Tax=Lewinella sp. 4G2 TaxID=1803372 RepID=UPI0007B466ED|nr:T9SS type A sorting domain-containing protein [Lewinella sp. 4G2]OAV43111.1 hypothetical protein A3850_000750 [Lewinella sp. 4G2]
MPTFLKHLILSLTLLSSTVLVAQDTLPASAYLSNHILLEGLEGNAIDSIYVDSVPTMVGSVAWHSVYLSSYSVSSQRTSGPFLKGRYRQEGQKVYYQIHSGDDQFTPKALIYDYSLSAGDTFSGLNIAHFPGDELVVYEIDSTDRISCYGLDSVKRMFIHITETSASGEPRIEYESVWVEGFGDINHPFVPFACNTENGLCEFYYANNIHRSGGDSLNLYPLRWCDALPILTSTSSPGRQIQALTVFPNPNARGIFNFNVEGALPINRLELYNSSGQLVSATDGQPGMRRFDLSSLGLRDGVYFLRAYSAEGAVWGSRVVLR